MTEKQVIKWIKQNLGSLMREATNGSIYTEDWLGGIVMRETGILLYKQIPRGLPLEYIAPLMKGDYGKRPTDAAPIYHGYGFTQIDIKSYPEFIKSGDWKSPLKCFKKSIDVLNEKRKYLVGFMPGLSGEMMERAITAAYNCGQGNVLKCLRSGLPVDLYTYDHNYSSEVFRYRKIYNEP